MSSIAELFRVSSCDVPTVDKIPIIRELMGTIAEGMALDIGSGTGYTTTRIFGGRSTVCIDLHAPNLATYRQKAQALFPERVPLCVMARATALPFKTGVFRYVLCSEVLEHLKEDHLAMQELARVMAPQGRAVITVPYSGFGFAGFLELLRIKTVHDYPGPEFHVRPGYDEQTMRALVQAHGLEIERQAYFLRFFTKLVTDVISVCHLLYQRVVHHRAVWTWHETSAVEGSFAFRVYAWLFPVVGGWMWLDRLLGRRRGFGLVVAVTKR